MGSSWPDILRITLKLVVAVDRLASPSLQVPRQGPLFCTNQAAVWDEELGSWGSYISYISAAASAKCHFRTIGGRYKRL